MHENESFAPGIISFASNIFKGNWAVHKFMHGILTHKKVWAKFSFISYFNNQAMFADILDC